MKGVAIDYDDIITLVRCWCCHHYHLDWGKSSLLLASWTFITVDVLSVSCIPKYFPNFLSVNDDKYLEEKHCSIYFTLIENINFGFLWNTSKDLQKGKGKENCNSEQFVGFQAQPSLTLFNGTFRSCSNSTKWEVLFLQFKEIQKKLFQKAQSQKFVVFFEGYLIFDCTKKIELQHFHQILPDWLFSDKTIIIKACLYQYLEYH